MTLWDYSGWVGVPARPYGDETTYKLGLGWLYEVCDLVEDWGAGLAYGARFCPAGKDYYAIDSSPSSAPFVNAVSDLREWDAEPLADGIFMRHVLEHNENWTDLLDWALGSFTRRMVLVIFTPFSETTHPLQPGTEILDLSFREKDLTDRFVAAGLAWTYQHVISDTQYKVETLFYLEKR